MTTSRLCILTGTNGVIGSSIAASLLANGYEVAAIGRTRPTGWRGDFTFCDFKDPEATEAACKTIASSREPVWALLNIAGCAIPGELQSVTGNAFGDVLRVNTIAPALLAAAVTPRMRDGGRIISISSIVAAGKFGRSVYAASKAALNALSNTWAIELGPLRITSNIVSPGPVDTPMLRDVYSKGSVEECNLLAGIPTGQFSAPSEVASTILFLLSNAASNITGQNICVDGGISVGIR